VSYVGLVAFCLTTGSPLCVTGPELSFRQENITCVRISNEMRMRLACMDFCYNDLPNIGKKTVRGMLNIINSCITS